MCLPENVMTMKILEKRLIAYILISLKNCIFLYILKLYKNNVNIRYLCPSEYILTVVISNKAVFLCLKITAQWNGF